MNNFKINLLFINRFKTKSFVSLCVRCYSSVTDSYRSGSAMVIYTPVDISVDALCKGVVEKINKLGSVNEFGQLYVYSFKIIRVQLPDPTGSSVLYLNAVDKDVITKNYSSAVRSLLLNLSSHTFHSRSCRGLSNLVGNTLKRLDILREGVVHDELLVRAARSKVDEEFASRVRDILSDSNTVVEITVKTITLNSNMPTSSFSPSASPIVHYIGYSPASFNNVSSILAKLRETRNAKSSNIDATKVIDTPAFNNVVSDTPFESVNSVATNDDAASGNNAPVVNNNETVLNDNIETETSKTKNDDLIINAKKKTKTRTVSTISR